MLFQWIFSLPENVPMEGFSRKKKSVLAIPVHVNFSYQGKAVSIPLLQKNVGNQTAKLGMKRVPVHNRKTRSKKANQRKKKHLPPFLRSSLDDKRDIPSGTEKNQEGSPSLSITAPVNPSDGSTHRLGSDLNRKARLISQSFIKPKYTLDAAEAGLEGHFIMKILVTQKGTVGDFSMMPLVGFGMDERLRAAAYGARYQAATDKRGNPIEGWIRQPIILVLE